MNLMQNHYRDNHDNHDTELYYHDNIIELHYLPPSTDICAIYSSLPTLWEDLEGPSHHAWGPSR